MAPLSEREREDRAHLKQRLEAFSDIVFAFTLSQSALQLQLPASAADLFSQPIRWVVFFGTFAIIAVFWLAHYRTFRLAFEPERLDIFLNFCFLAAIAVLPFAMQAVLKFGSDRGALALYAAAFAGISLPMALLLRRGLGRRNPRVTDAQRLRLWQACIRNVLILAASVIALGTLAFGDTFVASLAYPIFGAASLAVRRLVRTVPRRYLPEPAPSAGA